MSSSTGWIKSVTLQASENRLIAGGFLLAALIVIALWLQSIIGWALGKGPPGFSWAFYGGLAGWGATTLGALPALFLRRMPQKVEDSLLGIAAGMMLAASAFSLLLPGMETAETLTGSAFWASLIVILGIALGVTLMLGLDFFTPHEHENLGPCGAGHEHCRRVWLFVFAIALHNLPEGMAIGVSLSQADLSVGLPLTAAIALQDIPEGLAVTLALRRVGLSPMIAVGVASASGLLEPIGAILGAGLTGGLSLAYPLGLTLAGGAMIFVVSHEIIPETHRNGHQTIATIGLMVGFAIMMVLDTALG